MYKLTNYAFFLYNYITVLINIVYHEDKKR